MRSRSPFIVIVRVIAALTATARESPARVKNVMPSDV